MNSILPPCSKLTLFLSCTTSTFPLFSSNTAPIGETILKKTNVLNNSACFDKADKPLAIVIRTKECKIRMSTNNPAMLLSSAGMCNLTEIRDFFPSIRPNSRDGRELFSSEIHDKTAYCNEDLCVFWLITLRF